MKSFFLIPALASGMIWGTIVTVRADETSQAALPEVISDTEVLDLFAGLPVLDSGRIKPLDTVARFRLLRYHGKQSVKADDAALGGKKKLAAMEWVLLSWFRPEIAKDIPLFVVDNTDAVIELGIESLPAQRKHYSYNELLPGRAALMKKMQEVRQIEEKQRTPAQRYLAKLSVDFLDYEMMLAHFDFARSPFGAQAAAVPKEIVADPAKMPRIAELMPKLSAYFQEHPQAAAPMANPWLMEYFRSIFGARMSGNTEQALRIFPPSEKATEEWQSPGSIMQTALDGGQDIGKLQLEEFSQWESLFFLVDDATAFKKELASLHAAVVQAAEARGEGTRLQMEVKYHRRDYMTNALVFFIVGLLCLALSWTSWGGLWGRVMVGLCWLWMLLGAGFVTTGIVIRCLIMQRPPVATLYETILFITASGVIFALIAEALVNRKGIALLVAALTGTIGMFMSIRYMNMEGTDTLQQLQAVLLTNFWLATHVPTINLGYAAGMVAAILSMLYFLGRLLGLLKSGDSLAKSMTRIGYGFVMAGLFLSLVGTILGGIWANYSWGRFWGWDPKENGALMIVLMNLIILHARLGGFIRELGFHACNILLGMIVIFSWFGVNQLGVGLHSYGFTDGIWFWLLVFWSLQLLIILYALFLHLQERFSGRSKVRVGFAAPGGESRSS